MKLKQNGNTDINYLLHKWIIHGVRQGCHDWIELEIKQSEQNWELRKTHYRKQKSTT
jgi:hypothetical protein